MPPAADPPDSAGIPRAREIRELERMEATLVRADLRHPGTLSRPELDRLRYLLSFARLTTFRPGAALAGEGDRIGSRLLGGLARRRPADRADVTVAGALEAFRARVVDELGPPLQQESEPGGRLRGARAALERLSGPLVDSRSALLRSHGGDFSARELDAEVGRKVLVSIAGGGGGAGYVYIGAYQRLEEAGIVPAYVIGASIGALLGIFRARAAKPPWADYIALAKGLDRRSLFSAVSVRRRFGLPGLLDLTLGDAVAASFLREDGRPLRIADLEIPYEAVVAGVRSRSFERLPRDLREDTATPEEAKPRTRRSPLLLAPAVAQRMTQAVAFFDPRLTKPVVLGADPLTAGFDAVDAAGFSAAIPGVLHYDVHEDGPMAELLTELFEREEVAALVDGGVVANVPGEIAWRRVQAGKLGTRNAFQLAFDCFHPRLDPGQIWLQPVTRAIQLQMNRNSLFWDWVVRFDPTLSPVNLVPPPEQLDEAIGWGRAAIEEILPMLRRILEPVEWVD